MSREEHKDRLEDLIKERTLGVIFEVGNKVFARVYNRKEKEKVFYAIEMKDFGTPLKKAIEKVRERKKSKR